MDTFVNFVYIIPFSQSDWETNIRILQINYKWKISVLIYE